MANLWDLLKQHATETYGTLSQGKVGQDLRADANKITTGGRARLEQLASMSPQDAAMNFGPMGMAGSLKGLGNPLVFKKSKKLLTPKELEYPSQLLGKSFDEFDKDVFANLWRKGGFMPVSKMPLEKFLQEGPIENFTHFYNGGQVKGITKEPGVRGNIVSSVYQGLEDAASALKNIYPFSNGAERPYFSKDAPFDPSKELFKNGRFNTSADPYFGYNGVFDPNNLNFKGPNDFYNPVYQKIIDSMGPRNAEDFAYRRMIQDKATSIPPKELLQHLEKNFKLDVPDSKSAYLIRNDGLFAPKGNNPEHYNSYKNANSVGHIYNFHRKYSGLEAVTSADDIYKLDDDFTTKMMLRSSEFKPFGVPDKSPEALTISKTKPGSSMLLIPGDILAKQKDIAEQMPLHEYLYYFLKHGTTPFAAGGMMLNNNKEEQQ